jgi:Fe-Mn family superoxide dismutase
MEPRLSRRDAVKLVGAGTLLAAVELGCGPSSSAMGAAAGAAGGGEALGGAFEDGRYALPKLPYAYDALEPHYDAQTLQIHHTKHHAGYVQGLNRTLDGLAEARKAGDFKAVKALSRDLAFHGSGHLLHCLFWHSMTPRPGKPSGDLAAAMEKSFGSVEAGQAHFAAATKDVEGSGWGVLAYEPVGQKLLVLQAEKHQNLTVWGVTPLLVADVWEHAYYLKYQNRRAEWVDAFMKLANWDFAARRLAAASKPATA